MGYLLSAFLLNRLGEETYGGSPAPFDLLGWAVGFIASGMGLSAGEWLRTILDNGLEKMFGERLLETKPFATEQEFDAGKAAEELWYNASNDIPYIRNISALLGWGDETLPIPFAGGAGRDIVSSVRALRTGEEDASFRRFWEAVLELPAEVLPGGRQAQKAYQGLRTMLQGGRVYGYGGKERLQYPVGNSPAKWAGAILFGNNALSETDEFYASGLSGLTAKQTGLYYDLVDGGADGKTVYDTMQAIRQAGDSNAERTVLAAAALSDADKLDIFAGMIAGEESKRPQDIRDLLRAGLTFSEAMTVNNKYAELHNAENMTAGEKTAEFAYWLDGRGFRQQEVTAARKAFVFYTQSPVERTGYDKFREAGLDAEDALRLMENIDNLQPPAGREAVAEYQIIEAVSGAEGLTYYEKASVIRQYLDAGKEGQKSASQQEKFDKYVWDRGTPLEVYAEYLRRIDGLASIYNEKGKVVKSKKEQVVAVIHSLPLTRAQKDGLYLLSYAESGLDDAPWN